MTEMEAMEARHAVRKYKDKMLEWDAEKALRDEIDACNEAGNLHIQLVTNEKSAFDSPMGHAGKFKGVNNYIALVGLIDPALDEVCGYYGERIVLKAQMLGLNTCWVGTSYSGTMVKRYVNIEKGEKLDLVIALGYGETQGKPHRSKTVKQISSDGGEPVEWFTKGIKAVLLAPTAMNQQKFTFRRAGDDVITLAGIGAFTKVDLGIAKYHFEVASGRADCWLN